MSFNTNWDVDKYKTEYESEEHWDLRRNFMETHKNKFSEERLVCLAQVFTNVEFLGCRYPTETMQLVAQLSEGIADDYREKQKSKLQRTFVKASDAAGAKVKGLKRPAVDAAGPSDSFPKSRKCTDNIPPVQNVSSLEENVSNYSKSNIRDTADKPPCSELIEGGNTKSQDIKICSFVRATNTPVLDNKENGKKQDVNGVNGFEDNSNNYPVLEDDASSEKNDVRINCKSGRGLQKDVSKGEQNMDLDSEIKLINTEKYGRLVLIDKGDHLDAFTHLIVATSACGIPFRLEYEETSKTTYCSVFVNNHLLTTTSGFNKKDAREFAVKEAYEKLKQICYTLKIKLRINSDGTVIDTKFQKSDQDSCVVFVSETLAEKEDSGQGGPKSTDKMDQSTKDGNALSQPLESDIGSKLMRAMGWTGGGLGKEEQGIKEPISVLQKVNRAGLGLKISHGIKNSHGFRDKVSKMLRNYAQEDSPYDLVFSSDFTKEERALMHSLAQRFRLKSKSYGAKEDRSLVISKKKDFCQIVENMLRSGESSNQYYELIKPPISLFCETNSLPEPEINGKSEKVMSNPIKSCNSVDLHVVKEPEIVEVSHKVENVGVVKKRSIFMSGAFHVEDITKPLSTKQGFRDVIAGPFGHFILIEDETVVTNIQLIERSANACHVPFKFEYSSAKKGMLCKLMVNKIVVTSHTANSKKQAREGAVRLGIEKLKDVSFTLKSQIKMEDEKISVIRSLKKPKRRQNGLEGILDSIVCVSKEVDWPFLGLEHGANGVAQTVFKDKARSFLRRYLAEQCPFDLVLSPVFSAEQRSFIQKIATGLAIKTSSHEVSNKYFVVLSKKLTPLELAEAMLYSGGNASSDSIEPGILVGL